MNLFKKTYDGESLYDLGRDILEAFNSDYNPKVLQIPVDEYFIHKGDFIVTVEWVASEE